MKSEMRSKSVKSKSDNVKLYISKLNRDVSAIAKLVSLTPGGL